MKKQWTMRLLAVMAALTLFATACGDSETAAGTGDCDSVDEVSLQLQWVTQAQFAGYYAALDDGIYERYCLDVTIHEGGVDIAPQQQLASGAVDFAVSWVPKALVSREGGMDIVNVAQVFQRSGTLQVSWADSGINGPADLAGKVVGNWGWGNEFELLAGFPSGRRGSQQRLRAGTAELRHAGPAQGRDRRRPGDDLQRVRPDTGGDESGHR